MADDDQWIRAKRLLNDLLDAEPDDPTAWLDARCGDDEALRAEVESLRRAYRAGTLSAGDEAAGWLGAEDVAAFEVGGTDAARLQGQHVGPYHLVEEIGVGGMSVVYRAERADDAFERAVAVKLLQRRLHTDDAEQRFRAERQVLASLDHPNIAGLIDGGITEGGRPYLVMELVEGTPITEYADEKGLSVDARLDLLGQVLDAVEAAHRQLVVHRDLKPSNVFVTETEEGEPQVKLLDFGIAKLLDDSMPVTRPQTETGHQLMTPTYAAPEQVSGAEVTTRTDVYQLGVLAYELLAGARPFDLEGKSLTEIERTILETEPPAPSEVAAGRDKHDRAGDLRGDLDVIVQKALRKEPERRYPSVEALAADLRRHRAGEPVEARPATLGYRARKFVTRNATGVGVAAAFVALVVAAGALLLQQRNRARRNAERAQREAETAEQVSDYLADLLRSSDPAEAQGDTVTARDLLRRGREQIDDLDGQPAVKEEMLHLMGTIYRDRGEFSVARSLLERSLALADSLYGPPHHEIATSLSALGMLERESGRYKRADSLHRAAVDMRRETLGPRHSKVAESLNDLASATYMQGNVATAESLFEESLTVRRASDGRLHDETALTLQNLAVTHKRQGELRAADSLYRSALSIQRKLLGDNHPEIALTLSNLAALRNRQGQAADAESLEYKALDIRQEVFEPPHNAIARSYHGLGSYAAAQGDTTEAVRLYKKALSIRRKALPPDNPTIAYSLNNLGRIEKDRGNVRVADSLLQRAIEIKKDAFRPTNPSLALSLHYRGEALIGQERHSEASSLFREARAVLRKDNADHTRQIAMHNVALAEALIGLEQYRKAKQLLTRGLDTLRARQEEEYSRRALRLLVRLHERWERPRQAAAWRDSLSSYKSPRT